MDYCNRCGLPLASNTTYCTRCGARRLRPSAFSTPEPLPYEPPALPVQTVTAPPAEKAPRPGQGHGIAGLVLSIVALAVSGIVFLFCFFIGGLVGLAYGESSVIGIGLAVGAPAVPYIVELPILGLSFSLSARRQGYVCRMSSTGVALSCIAFGLQGIMVFYYIIYSLL